MPLPPWRGKVGMGGNSRVFPPTSILPHTGGGGENGRPIPPGPYPGAYAPDGGGLGCRGRLPQEGFIEMWREGLDSHQFPCFRKHFHFSTLASIT